MKTRREILKDAYIRKTHIAVLLGVPRSTANKLYQIADEIDNEQLGAWRVEPQKVRMKTLLRVAGIDYKFLERQIYEEH